MFLVENGFKVQVAKPLMVKSRLQVTSLRSSLGF